MDLYVRSMMPCKNIVKHSTHSMLKGDGLLAEGSAVSVLDVISIVNDTSSSSHNNYFAFLGYGRVKETCIPD